MVRGRLLKTVAFAAALQAFCALASAAAPEIELVHVRGGCFEMGDTFEDGDNDEKPVHMVCVNDFSLGKYEVTQEQWIAVMGSNPSKFQGNRLPVEQVNWSDAQQFIAKLNALSGKHYRLPTEAEWEYAARSRGRKVNWAGTSDEKALGEYAWYGKNSDKKTHAVGTRKPNGLGIYDMTGNVWEWVEDRYDDAYYETSPRHNPQGSSVGPNRVSRGGSWDYSAEDSRASYRCRSMSDKRFNDLGFRLCTTH